MAAERRLHANLIALARHEPNLEERCPVERLYDAIFADRLASAPIAWMRFLLYERRAIPDQMVAPGPGVGRRTAVDDRLIHALGLVALELILEALLRVRALCEDHEPRAVTIDSMDDERRPFAAVPKVVGQLVIDRRRLAAALERDGQ